MARTYQTILEEIKDLFLDQAAQETVLPIHLAKEGSLPDSLSPEQRDWFEATDFAAKPGTYAFLPDGGSLAGIVAGVSKTEASPLLAGWLASAMPKGDYRLDWEQEDVQLAAIAWAMGRYGFQDFKSSRSANRKRLQLPADADREAAANIAGAVWFGRDLINRPANDLGPHELEAAVRDVAAYFGAECQSIVGDDLLTENFPLIHAVGRASPRAPRLIELNWGASDAPRITLVGKGICFDTGGLNIKVGTAMTLMKKDMGGAAATLALAAMIMGAKLPVRLRLLIASAENSISGNAFRPGDVLKSRAGLTIEIGNTDAEGRLVLADALALADEDGPEKLFSFATLTGSARIALGPDLPPIYSTDSALADDLTRTGMEIDDPMWPMPFWAPYDTMLKARTGDINSVASSPFAGSILAALFLKRFVKTADSYTHFDIYGWVPKTQPGKPIGGEPQCARAVFAYLKGAYPK
jgi:leucyl aminopeptidase